MKEFTLNEIDSIYAHAEDRFIVSLIVGYTEEDLFSEQDAANGGENTATPREAARWALDLTRDEGASGTYWFVFDRKTGKMHTFEQHEFDPEMEDALVRSMTLGEVGVD
jgi:hypothetical protein